MFPGDATLLHPEVIYSVKAQKCVPSVLVYDPRSPYTLPAPSLPAKAYIVSSSGVGKVATTSDEVGGLPSVDSAYARESVSWYNQLGDSIRMRDPVPRGLSAATCRRRNPGLILRQPDTGGPVQAMGLIPS